MSLVDVYFFLQDYYNKNVKVDDDDGYFIVVFDVYFIDNCRC